MLVITLAALALSSWVLGKPVSRPGWGIRSLPFNTSFLSDRLERRASWTLTQPGTTGVSAMQLVVVSSTQALVIDRAEHNPLQINGHGAWSAIYDLVHNTVRPVDLITNSFCAGGQFISNGTLINIGGNPTNAPDLGDLNGYQGIRLFNPSECADTAPQCAFYENPDRIRLTSNRWYPSGVRLDDGSILIVGGARGGGFINSQSGNNPTYEFYPPKALNGFNGTQIPSAFLVATLNANLFAHVFLLPSGSVMIVANQKAILYNWRTNVETPLPDIPNGVRVTYPMAGTGVLLPMSQATGFVPVVLLCGGSTKSDTADVSTYSSQDPASAQCASLEVTAAGILRGWQVEMMPVPRIMPDAVLLPTGQVLIVNGGKTGYSGYGNVRNRIGASNADNPAFQPVIYDPTLPFGQRFSSAGLPTSTIARLYHSTASLTASGSVIIAGSNPNGDVSTVKYATEYRLEVLSPPYMQMQRPTFTGLPAKWSWKQSVSLNLGVPIGTTTITAVLMDFGYSTHAVHMGQRLIQLPVTWSGSVTMSASGSAKATISVSFAASASVMPPGPAWFFVLANGVPSVGQQVMIGSGASPPVDLGAIANMLATTYNPI